MVEEINTNTGAHAGRSIQSNDISKLAEALATAQGMFEHAKKQAENDHFKHKYADLASVIDAARKPLSDNGLSVVQLTDMFDGKLYLVTTLAHKSGQWMRGWFPLTPVKTDPQSMGSALTYARRYSFGAITGIASDEDDDGNNASGRGTPSVPVKSAFENPALRQLFLDNTSVSFDKSESVDSLNELVVLAKPKAEEMRASGDPEDAKVAETLRQRYQARLKALKDVPPATVCQQIILSKQHHLDKFWLLLTTPLKADGSDRTERINRLINDLSATRMPYISVYSPHNCAGIFLAPTMAAEDFQREELRTAFDDVDFDQVQKLFLKLMSGSTEAATHRPLISDDEPVPVPATSLNAMNETLKWGHTSEELDYTLKEMRAFFLSLKAASRQDREFYLLCVERATLERGPTRFFVPVSVIGTKLNSSSRQLKQRVESLAYFGLADFGGFHDGDILISTRNGWAVSNDIRDFAEDKNIDLRRILVDLNFSLLD